MGQRWLRLLVPVFAFALIATACGDDDEGGTASTTTSANVATTPTTTLAPQKGGILNAGQFTGIQGLDPAKLAGAGSVGAIELSAIYDTLMRYNPETKKYEGRTARVVGAERGLHRVDAQAEARHQVHRRHGLQHRGSQVRARSADEGRQRQPAGPAARSSSTR